MDLQALANIAQIISALAVITIIKIGRHAEPPAFASYRDCSPSRK